MADWRKAKQDGAMTSTVDSFAPLRFSANDLPERDRIAICREVFGRHVVKLQLEGIPDIRFLQTVTLRSLPGLSLMFGNSSGLRAERSRMLIPDGNDDLVLNVATKGVSHVSQIGGGARAARLSAIKTDIRAGVGQTNLSLEAIARHQGISPRYVRKLFELEGTTFTEFVLDQRLARAHRMLIDRQFGDRTIGAIAFEAGFGDLSYFNRAFRRRYGATPSDVRAATQREWE
jgi:AraC-like DNA-binding protein